MKTHWLNVLCVLGLVAVGTVILNADALGVNNGGKVILKTTHVWIGYVFVLNLLWRFVWGFIGGPVESQNCALGYATVRAQTP